MRRIRISDSTRRKSVVTARSALSKSWPGPMPGQAPWTPPMALPEMTIMGLP